MHTAECAGGQRRGMSAEKCEFEQEEAKRKEEGPAVGEIEMKRD